MLAQAAQAPVPWPPPGHEPVAGGDVDALLDAAPAPKPPPPPRATFPTSVEVDFDEPTAVGIPRFVPESSPPPASASPAEPEPVSISAEPEPEPVSVGAVPEPEPVSISAVPEPEPVSVSAEPEPEPVSVGAAPEPEPVSVGAAPEPEPVSVGAAPEPEPEPARDEPEVGGISLASVQGLEDLPDEAQAQLAISARLERLGAEEEIGNFAVALVVSGWVSIMPAIADASCAKAGTADVVFTQGTLEEGIALRVVAGEDDTVVAVWETAAIDAATADCPWVADELRAVADRFQALAGAAMGELGDRFDDTLRATVTDRCEVRTLLPGERIVEQGKPVPGLFIVGGGRVEIVGEGAAEPSDELGPGDFVFSAQVLSASPAPAGARAGKDGALVLFAERHAAHELMLSVPPLLEILAG